MIHALLCIKQEVFRQSNCKKVMTGHVGLSIRGTTSFVRVVMTLPLRRELRTLCTQEDGRNLNSFGELLSG